MSLCPLFGLWILMGLSAIDGAPPPLHHHGHPESRIIGGDNVDISQYPYQVSIRSRLGDPKRPLEHVCGGSIVSSTIVVSAAHCFLGALPSNFHVVAGTSLREGSDGSIAPVKRIIPHEHYNERTVANDIALLILGAPLPINNLTIKAIELNAAIARVGALATVTGWGSTGEGFPDTLQMTKVPIMSNDLCNEDYNPEANITEGMMCAGFRDVGGKDTCSRDSGGPLVLDHKLAGVISWGYGCGKPHKPGVYTRISYYRSWLLEKISENQ